MPDPNHICDLHHSSRQRPILNPVSEARDRTRNLMIPSQFHCTMTGTPVWQLICINSRKCSFHFILFSFWGPSVSWLLEFLKCTSKLIIFFLFHFKLFPSFFFCLFYPFRAAPTAYGGSQARSLIGAVAAGLCHSHSNIRSEPHVRPTPQLMAMPDPQPTEPGQGSNPQHHGS